jgi:hypothetical protein
MPSTGCAKAMNTRLFAARFAAYFRAQAKAVGARYGRIPSYPRLAAIETDSDNPRAALEWTRDAGSNGDYAAQLAGSRG